MATTPQLLSEEQYLFIIGEVCNGILAESVDRKLGRATGYTSRHLSRISLSTKEVRAWMRQGIEPKEILRASKFYSLKDNPPLIRRSNKKEIAQSAAPLAEQPSLRDYFAAAALIGLCANPNLREDVKITTAAYEIADFMIQNREKSND